MLGFLGDLLGLNAGNATIDAGNQNKQVVQNYGTTANNLIDTGATQAGGYLDQAKAGYDPLVAQYGAGSKLYADALGVNGDAGSQAATDAFHTAPGYDFALNQGLDAIQRRAASMGSNASGGTSADLMKYGIGTADQAYNDWLSNLAGYDSKLSGAVAGSTGTLDNLANLATGTASAKTGVAGEVASGTTSANNQVASGQEANTAGIAKLGGTLFNLAGNFLGYGGF